MAEDLETLFADRRTRLRDLRSTDAAFDEICAHFEILLRQAESRFGTLDAGTTDLIASFDDLRREIERHLATAAASNTGPEPPKG